MSDLALKRVVVVRSLKRGEDVPSDGRVYREADGKLSFSLRYTPDLQGRHHWLLSLAENHEKRRAK